MSTIVCQSLVSCFEPQLFETTTTLKLKVANLDDDDGGGGVTTNPAIEFGQWGIIQTAPKESPLDCKDSCFSTPWVPKTSFSKLTDRFLAMCTETLGCETGTETVAVNDGTAIFRSSYSGELSTTSFHQIPDDEFHSTVTRNSPPKKLNLAKNTREKLTDFPPPLTTMNGLKMRPHREGGRLVIEAVETPFGKSYLETERSDGRLRMRFFEPEEEIAVPEQEDKEKSDEISGETAVENEIEGGGMGTDELMEEDGNNFEKYEQRMCRRCKEGSHGNNWKPAPLWVATS